MHPVVNHLVQLQELVLIRDEQKVASGGAHLEELNASINSMRDKLPPDIRAQYNKLNDRDHVVIVPATGGVCTGCGMSLPTSLVQAVQASKALQNCPNCARMMYWQKAAARRLGKPPRRTAPRKLGVARFSSQSLMVPALAATDVEGAITELAEKMEAEGFVDSAERMVEEALRREAILSTGVDHGLAFPHVRGLEGGGLTMAVGISRKGIRWGNGRALTRIVFLIGIPTAAAAFYLKLLAGLAETFMKADARNALMAEKDPANLWKVLVKVTRSTVK
jgi:mannitol/fructose-specific phosphotransferase system IIA component (Ntr-type)